MCGLADWSEVSLGDHVDLLTGFPFKSAQYTDDPGDLRLLRGDNVAQGHLRWNGVKRWPVNEHQQYAKFDLHAGDVILAMDRPWIEAGLKWGWVKSPDLPCLLVQRVSRLRGINGLSTTYLRYLIGSQSFTDYIKPIVTGVNVPHISAAQIKGFRFQLPPVEKQDRIAAIMSAYDDLIENNTRRIAILEEMARALYQEWFVHFRFPGHEHVPLVDSPLGPIPEGWEVLSFGQIAQVEGRSFDPSQSPLEVFAHFSFPAFDTDQMPALEQGSGILSNKLHFDIPCVLLAKLNPRIPRIWPVFAAPDAKRICSTEFLPLMAGEPFSPALLAAFCRTQEFNGRFRSMALGTSTSHQRVRPRDLEAMPVVVASQELLARADQLIGPAYALAENLRRRNQNLRITRDLLLPKLISGEIDVSAVAEEPIAEAAD
jgi:type I restriction enzyme S subunit